jgi:3-oxoacyl-[acyl-carrier protein] reductase
VHAVAADVSKSDEAGRAIKEAVTRLGGLDILVTNSGGPPSGLFESLEESAWRAAVDLLLISTVRMVKEALPSLKKSNQGRIVHLTSLTVKQPVPGLVLSNAVRAAVVGLAKSLSQELAADGVLVNVVAPGIVDTERVRELDEANAAQQKRSVAEVAGERIKTIPLGRMGRAEEVASLIVFLASAQASYITGTTIPVDGGLIRGV